MTIHVYSFDFDGCIYNQKYRIAREIYPNQDNVIIYNQTLLDAIKLEMQQADVKKGIVFVGSLRQSYRLDKYNSDENGTGSCFNDITHIAKYIGAEFDPLLLADIYERQDDGVAYTKIKDPNTPAHKQSQTWADESKFLFSFAQMQKTALKYPDEEIVFNFYDDREDILGLLHKCFSKCPHYIPKNLTLQLHQYAGEETHRYTPIKGTGEVDPHYRNRILNLANDADQKAMNVAGNILDSVSKPSQAPAPATSVTTSTPPSPAPSERNTKHNELIQNAIALDTALKAKTASKKEDFATKAYNELQNEYDRAKQNDTTDTHTLESLKHRTLVAQSLFQIDIETGAYIRKTAYKPFLPVIPEIHELDIPEITANRAAEWKISKPTKHTISTEEKRLDLMTEYQINCDFIPQMCGSFANPDFYLDLIETFIDTCKKSLLAESKRLGYNDGIYLQRARLETCYVHINEYIATIAASIANIANSLSKEIARNTDNVKTAKDHSVNALQCAHVAESHIDTSTRHNQSIEAKMNRVKSEYERRKDAWDYLDILSFTIEQLDPLTHKAGCNERTALKYQMVADAYKEAAKNYTQAPAENLKTTADNVQAHANPKTTADNVQAHANNRKEEIISFLIQREKCKSQAEYDSQKKALDKVFSTIEDKSPLSLNLIKTLHITLSPAPKRHPWTAPELVGSIPGEFRNDTVGTSIIKCDSSESFTKEGISEILDILENEDDFDQYKGTWFGPYDRKQDTLSLNESLRNDNLQSRRGQLTKEAFTEQAYQDTQKRPYIVLFPRHSKSFGSINSYMEHQLNHLINSFNKEIELVSPDDHDAIKRKIAIFIKSCIRLHPFEDVNHRVFALCILNFLLLRHNIGYCRLDDRRIFATRGVNETLSQITQNLTTLSIKDSKDSVEIKTPKDAAKNYTQSPAENLNATADNAQAPANNPKATADNVQAVANKERVSQNTSSLFATPKASEVPQIAKTIQAGRDTLKNIPTFPTRFVCISKDPIFQKMKAEQFANEILFFHQNDQHLFQSELLAVAKRKGKPVTDIIEALERQTKEIIYATKLDLKARNTIAEYHMAINGYLEHHNVKTLEYLFYNSVANNNSQVAALVYCRLRELTPTWDLDKDSRFHFVKDMLFSKTRDERACEEMDNTIGVAWIGYERQLLQNQAANDYRPMGIRW